MQEFCCPALNVSELLDVGMPAACSVALNDPKMKSGPDSQSGHMIDQLKQVAETCFGTPDRKRGNINLAVYKLLFMYMQLQTYHNF
jgi:hypothetical protein